MRVKTAKAQNSEGAMKPRSENMQEKPGVQKKIEPKNELRNPKCKYNPEERIPASARLKNFLYAFFRQKVAYIDETTYSEERGRDNEYVAGSTVLRGSKAKRFGMITEKRYEGEEMKFNHIKFRDSVLKEISMLGPGLYSVTVRKPAGSEWNKNEDKNVHRNAVYRIMKKISDTESSKDVHFVIDNNDKAKYGVLKEMIDDLSAGRRRKLTFEINKSSEDFQLQTNDYPVGSMGKMYNFDDDSFAKRLKKKVKRTVLSEEDAKKDVRENFGKAGK